MDISYIQLYYPWYLHNTTSYIYACKSNPISLTLTSDLFVTVRIARDIAIKLRKSLEENHKVAIINSYNE